MYIADPAVVGIVAAIVLAAWFFIKFIASDVVAEHNARKRHNREQAEAEFHRNLAAKYACTLPERMIFRD
jgi:hypothetical protein